MALDLAQMKASNGSGEAVRALVTVLRSPGGTVLTPNSLVNYPTDYVITTGPLLSDGTLNPAKTLVARAHTVGATIVIDELAPGYIDTYGSAVGDVIVIKPTTWWADTIVQKAVDGVTATALVQTNLTNTVANDDVYRNVIINSGASIAQRPTAPNLSTTYQFGQVDRFAVKATGTAVSAGTVAQTVTPALTVAQKALKIAGATITGTGIVFIRHRIEARDAANYKNQIASFAAQVRHDIGTSVNATIYINKPTVADNFTSVTAIANSGAIAIPTGADTQIKFQNITLGDVSNGIEIEIQIATGAITTKNIELSQFVFNRGATTIPFVPRIYELELAMCQRYHQEPVPNGTTSQGIASAYIGGTTFQTACIPLTVSMRAGATLQQGTGLAARYGGADYNWNGTIAISNQTPTFIQINTNSATGGTNGNAGVLWCNGGGIIFDAEL